MFILFLCLKIDLNDGFYGVCVEIGHLDREFMGNASSMLTQYDIEEVQEHCDKLCGLIHTCFRLISSFVLVRG